MEPGFSSAAERTAPMTCAERRAVAFVHLIAEWHPEPGSPIVLAVTAARRLSVALHVEAGPHIAERKTAVQEKSVSVREDTRGRRIIKKNNTQCIYHNIFKL